MKDLATGIRRRSFLGLIIAGAAAPAIVRPASLMPIKVLPSVTLWDWQMMQMRAIARALEIPDELLLRDYQAMGDYQAMKYRPARPLYIDPRKVIATLLDLDELEEADGVH